MGYFASCFRGFGWEYEAHGKSQVLEKCLKDFAWKITGYDLWTIQ